MNQQYPPTSPAPGATGQVGGNEQPGKASTRQTIAQTARDAASKMKAVAGETAARAKQEAGRLAAERKDAASDRVGGYSSALHDSARSFEEQDPNIAWFAHQAADRLQGVADYIRQRDFATLREDCCGIARRHPAAFFGGLFVAGLLVGNMMKATARPRDDGRDSLAFDDSDWRNEAADYSTETSAPEGIAPGTPAPGSLPGATGV